MKVAEGSGDLTYRLPEQGRDEVSRMARGFNGFVAYIERVIDQTVRTTNAVIGGVATTNEATSRIADRIMRQQQETDQVAAAITEMSASVAEVSNSAANADGAARDALTESRHGMQIVQDTAGGIKSLAERLANASDLINRLDSDVQSIRSVIDVIRGIAEQTNLLALNAAIEAARAGESGRGFAVVADEVRTLANRTHASTVEIEDMIARLGSSADGAVSLMSSGSEMAESNAAQAEQAIEALTSIETAVQTISELNGQIAIAVKEQRVAAEDIHQAAERVREAGTENAAEATRAREESVRLGDLIARLQELIGRFKISNAGFDFEKAKSAHLAWRARVRNYLDGKSSMQPQEVVSHRDCVLGKWYYAEGLANYGHLAEMRELEQPHSRLHALIGEIVERNRLKDPAGAEQLFTQLANLSDSVIAALDRLQNRVRNDQGSGNQSG